MRKAVQQATRRSSNRRKQQDGPPPVEKDAAPKRKMTPDEAALTAKNYRMAKELSELRVRHREECKKSTRLSMENMNLASRCREAISHVAMLKKEIANMEKAGRHINAVERKPFGSPEKVKRSQSKQPNSPGSHTNTTESPHSGSSDSGSPSEDSDQKSSVVAEMDRMDRLLKKHAETVLIPPQQPLLDHEEKIVSIMPVPQPGAQVIGSLVSSDDYDEDDSEDMDLVGDISKSLNDVSKEEWVQTESKTNPFFPHSASPKMHKGNYNEQYPGDLTSFRKPTLKPHLDSLGDFKEMDDDGSTNSGASPSLAPFEKLPLSEDKSTMSSIDAFEASFQTNFPDSFSPREDFEEKKTSVEIYNPFSPTPSPKKPGKQDSPPSGGNSIRERATAAFKKSSRRGDWGDPPGKDKTSGDLSFSLETKKQQQRIAPVPPMRENSSKTVNSPSKQVTPNSEPHEEQLRRSLSSSVSRPENSLSNSVKSAAVASPVQTVPKAADPMKFKTPPSHDKGGTSQPTRPEKVGQEVARSRYEKALQSRESLVEQSKKEGNGSSRTLAQEAKTPIASPGVPPRSAPSPPSASSSPSNPSIPSLKERVAAYVESASPRTLQNEAPNRIVRGRRFSKGAFYPPSDEEDNGDIPLNSTLTPPRRPGPLPLTSATDGGVNRPKSWEGITAGQFRNGGVPNESPLAEKPSLSSVRKIHSDTHLNGTSSKLRRAEALEGKVNSGSSSRF